ncbi:hypothetical protein B566_EDAN006646 [Ephemera danica]|nr:hypothetical protein B566_EDAN006646 [Ephemera danica]
MIAFCNKVPFFLIQQEYTYHIINMNLFTFIGICLFLYFVIHTVILFLVDCDIRLKIAEKFGKSINAVQGKVVWVTGASSGIGEYIAIWLARGGAKVVLSARRSSELERLDILVNNAGRSQRAAWEETEMSVDRQLFELNVFSVVSLTRVVLKYFAQCSPQMNGHIVVTSSLAGLVGAPFSPSYTGAKHALHKFDQSVQDTDKRMSADRCGQLCAIAIANELYEGWMALFPLMPMIYFALYYPNMARLALKLMGGRRLQELRDSRQTVGQP